MGRVRDVLALGAWTLLLLAAEAGVLAALRALAVPGTPDARVWAVWLGSAPPEHVVVALGAVVAAGTGAYLLVATVVATAASVAGASPARAVRRCLPAPLVHGLARRAVGASLAASVALGPIVPAAADDRVAGTTGPPVPALPWLERAGPSPPEAGTLPPEAGTLPPEAGRAPGPVLPTEPARQPELPRPVNPPTSWTVAPGDHFWSIAERVLADAWGRRPRDRELVPYWRTVIDANRDRLVVPGEPDLILPGQQFVVPDPPAEAG